MLLYYYIHGRLDVYLRVFSVMLPCLEPASIPSPGSLETVKQTFFGYCIGKVKPHIQTNWITSYSNDMELALINEYLDDLGAMARFSDRSTCVYAYWKDSTNTS